MQEVTKKNSNTKYEIKEKLISNTHDKYEKQAREFGDRGDLRISRADIDIVLEALKIHAALIRILYLEDNKKK